MLYIILYQSVCICDSVLSINPNMTELNPVLWWMGFFGVNLNEGEYWTPNTLPPNFSITVFISFSHTLMKTGLDLLALYFFYTLPVLVICSFSASCGFTDVDYLRLKVRQYFKADSLSRWVTGWRINQGGEDKTKNTFHALRQKSSMLSQVCVCVHGKLLTWVLKVDIIAVVGIFQLVGHHPQSHDLLADEGVWAGDVHSHLRVIHLVGQSILLNFREVSFRFKIQTNKINFVLFLTRRLANLWV